MTGDPAALEAFYESLRPLPRPRSVAGLEQLIRQELHWEPAAELDALLVACRAGDTGAADELMALATNRLRGHVVAWTYKAKLPQPVLRAALAAAWEHDHQWTLQASGTHRALFTWFQAAAFELPPELPDPLTVWRGTTRMAPYEASGGLSWTTKREVACWFACAYWGRRAAGEPLVLRREVPLSDVLFYHEGRGEYEVVVFKGGPVEVDGTPEEWRRVAEAWEASRRVSDLADIA